MVSRTSDSSKKLNRLSKSSAGSFNDDDDFDSDDGSYHSNMSSNRGRPGPGSNHHDDSAAAASKKKMFIIVFAIIFIIIIGACIGIFLFLSSGNETNSPGKEHKHRHHRNRDHHHDRDRDRDRRHRPEKPGPDDMIEQVANNINQNQKQPPPPPPPTQNPIIQEEIAETSAAKAKPKPKTPSSEAEVSDGGDDTSSEAGDSNAETDKPQPGKKPSDNEEEDENGDKPKDQNEDGDNDFDDGNGSDDKRSRRNNSDNDSDEAQQQPERRLQRTSGPFSRQEIEQLNTLKKQLENEEKSVEAQLLTDLSLNETDRTFQRKQLDSIRDSPNPEQAVKQVEQEVISRLGTNRVWTNTKRIRWTQGLFPDRITTIRNTAVLVIFVLLLVAIVYFLCPCCSGAPDAIVLRGFNNATDANAMAGNRIAQAVPDTVFGATDDTVRNGWTGNWMNEGSNDRSNRVNKSQCRLICWTIGSGVVILGFIYLFVHLAYFHKLFGNKSINTRNGIALQVLDQDIGAIESIERLRQKYKKEKSKKYLDSARVKYDRLRENYPEILVGDLDSKSGSGSGFGRNSLNSGGSRGSNNNNSSDFGSYLDHYLDDNEPKSLLARRIDQVDGSNNNISLDSASKRKKTMLNMGKLTLFSITFLASLFVFSFFSCGCHGLHTHTITNGNTDINFSYGNEGQIQDRTYPGFIKQKDGFTIGTNIATQSHCEVRIAQIISFCIGFVSLMLIIFELWRVRFGRKYKNY